MVSFQNVCLSFLLQRIGLQSSDKYVHYIIIIYGDGFPQGFIWELVGDLVHNTIIGYVNKLTALAAFYIF